MGTEPVDYCREIETYLCQKNDGHLVRVVGPSFDLVSRWAAQGIPVKVAFEGVDRYFERYYRKGPRRRPVKIDFCEADVLDAFEEWRRAIGLPAAGPPMGPVDQPADVDAPRAARAPSLPAHLERAVMRLTQGRVSGALGAGFDVLIDRVARELDAARAPSHGLRGESRRALIDRLSVLDRELIQSARAALDEASLGAAAREAEEELAGYRDRMSPDAFTRAREAAIDRLVRERCHLPVLTVP